MNNCIRALKDYLGAGRLIFKLRLWRYLLIPALISLLYFPGIIWFGWAYMDDSAAYLRDNWLPTWMQHGVIVWVLNISMWIGAVYFGFTFYRNVIMIVFSPVLGIVSEKTEAGILSIAIPTNERAAVWRGMKRGVKMSLTSLGLSLLAFVLCWALVLIPILGGMLLAVCLPLSQMFLAGQGFLDPTLERKDYGVRESLEFCWRNRMRTIGCGAGFTVLALIPIVGWFLAPGFGIVAGTRSAVDLLGEQY